MKLYIEAIKFLFGKIFLKKDNGTLIREFCEKMGVVYIKFAQILATQNYGNLFTEEDRKKLSSICDDCNEISANEIENILINEYGNERLHEIFEYVESRPVGSASISQVHKAKLKTGEDVVVKVKRKDITNNIEKDIETLKKIVNKFGWIVKFDNYSGGNHALDLYLGWVKQEIDFRHEMYNIKTYQEFADTVNGKVENTKKIKVPTLYEQYCTDNVIVMEYIKYTNINKMPLTEENKEKINEAFNSYIKSSFWAMFNDKQIVFHGDPHSGNICIDDDGNICFLDMGLLCVLSDKDAKLCRKFFLTAYSGNYEKLFDFLKGYGNFDVTKENMFKEDLRKTLEQLKDKDVTHYFTDIMNICLYYEFVPPDFLFGMAKAFVCLNGISNFCENNSAAKELLQQQVVEYLLQRSYNDLKNVTFDSVELPQKILIGTLHEGLIKTIAKEFSSNDGFRESIFNMYNNITESFDLIKNTYGLNFDLKK